MRNINDKIRAVKRQNLRCRLRPGADFVPGLSIKMRDMFIGRLEDLIELLYRVCDFLPLGRKNDQPHISNLHGYWV